MVQEFDAFEINLTAIEAQWSEPLEPNGIITQYEVQYNESSVFVSGDTTSVIISGLQTFVEYDIRVRAFTSQGNGPFTGIIRVRTDPGPASPPIDIGTTVDRRYIVLTWSPPVQQNGIIEGYYIITNASTPVGIEETMTPSTAVPALNITESLTVNFTDLYPFTFYSFSIAAYSFLHSDNNNNFTIIEGNFSETIIEQTSQAASSPPLNFMLQQMQDSSTELQATWTTPTTLNGIISTYTVYCRNSSTQMYSEMIPSEDEFTLFDTTDSAVTELTLTGLTPFTMYDCYVTATTGGGESQPSNNDTARTDEAAPDGPPRNFTTTDITATTISLEWIRPQVPNGIITMYTLEYANDTSTNVIEIPVVFIPMKDEYDVTSTTVEFLNEFTNYTFTISATTGGGVGPSETVMVTTGQAAPTAAPADLMAINSSATSILVTWSPPPEDDQNGIILGYNITYFVVGDELSTTMSTSEITTTINITGLDIYTEYNISVAAYTIIDTGPYDTVVTRTDSSVPTAPTDLTYENITSTSITLRWNEPSTFNGPNEGYQVTVTRLENNTVVETIPTQNTSINITALEIYELYNISVVALSDKGPGDSVDITILTDEDNPGPPQDVSAVTLNDTAIMVTWAEPLDPNGILDRYDITYQLQPLYSDYLEGSVVTVPSDGLMIVLEDLHEFAGYDITVRAINGAGMGEEVSVAATTQPAAPSMGVSDLMVSSDITSATVTWTPPNRADWNGLLTDYTIRYYSNDTLIQPDISGEVVLFANEFNNNNNPSVATDPLQRESVVVPDLEEFVNYVFTVTVATSNGSNSPEDTPSADNTTLEAAPSGSPLNVSVAVISSIEAIITWQPPQYIERNGIINGYLISINDTRNVFNETKRVDGNMLTYIATGLPEFDRFNVSVAAMTAAGIGPPSMVVFNMTQEGVPTAPRDVRLTSPDPQIITVNWAEPMYRNGIITRYIVTYIGRKESGSQDFNGLNELMHLTIEEEGVFIANLTGLVADSIYNVNVTACTSVGCGPPGVGGDITLPPGEEPPPFPTNITLPTPPEEDQDAVTDTTITVAFSVPPELSANGDIMRVRIVMRAFGSSNNGIDTYYNVMNNNFDSTNVPGWQAIEVTADSRKRQNGVVMVEQTVGTESVEDCTPDREVCNGPLQPGTEYQYKYRAYTSLDDDNAFVESGYSEAISTAPQVTRQPTSNAGTVAAIVVVVLILAVAVVVVIIIVIIFYRRRLKRAKYAFASNGTDEVLLNENTRVTLTRSVPTSGGAGPTIVPLSDSTTYTNSSAAKTPSVKATPQSRKVYLKDLPSYVADMSSDAGFKFSEEYEKVGQIGVDHSKDASLLPENRAKNRYTNILAYDHSRVKLDSIDDDPGSDYINANYIPGYRMRRAYIATQGPLPSTFDDFWRMCWEQNVHTIVMLTQLVERGRTKCHRYWPGSQPETYGEINVEMMSEMETTDWIVRKFKLYKEKRSRMVSHYQFITWPDHGVPETATGALDFVKVVHEAAQSTPGPIVVHCSAGVGRTGTFIALGTLLAHIKDHDWIDLFGIACEMRQHRNHMIQTEAQYIFTHKAMVEVCESLNNFSPGKSPRNFEPLYANVGASQSSGMNSQQSDIFGGDLLSEEAAFVKAYDESKF